MNKEALRNHSLTLGFFWSLIILAWGLTWYHIRSNTSLRLWIALGIILVLIVACAVWLVIKWKRIGQLDPLPWYLVIGPRGSGKATLLKQSGLREVAVSGDDSFVAQRSIVLDKVGGYALDESLTADASARQEYLADLEQFLRGRSLKGIIATIEVPTALDSTGNRQHAQALRTHLDEIVQQLGLRLPVYLVITKCDLLQGFVPFFESLSSAERAQGWGATLTGDQQSDPVAAFDKEYIALQQALDEHRLVFMSTTNPVANGAIYQFPTQFALVCQSLRGCIETLFTPSTSQERPLFRGFYYTSAVQPNVAHEQRSYFVKDLLMTITESDQNLAQPNERIEHQSWLWRMALSAGAFVLGVVLIKTLS